MTRSQPPSRRGGAASSPGVSGNIRRVAKPARPPSLRTERCPQPAVRKSQHLPFPRTSGMIPVSPRGEAPCLGWWPRLTCITEEGAQTCLILSGHPLARSVLMPHKRLERLFWSREGSSLCSGGSRSCSRCVVRQPSGSSRPKHAARHLRGDGHLLLALASCPTASLLGPHHRHLRKIIWAEGIHVGLLGGRVGAQDLGLGW